MRLLGVDFGFKRIGLASVDADTGLPQALKPLAAAGALKKDAAAIASVARSEAAELIVLGLPIDPEGEEGRMAGVCRQLGAHIESLGFPVAYVDEQLTSVTAEGRLIEAGLKASQRKKRLDGQAAALILERYLQEFPHNHV